MEILCILTVYHNGVPYTKVNVGKIKTICRSKVMLLQVCYRVCNMLKVNFGTVESKLTYFSSISGNIWMVESKLERHIGTDHRFCAQRKSDLAEKQNLLLAVPQFTLGIHAIHFQHFLSASLLLLQYSTAVQYCSTVLQLSLIHI